MILSDFKTITHGKWILTGEHAVLRGHEALVFPVLDKELILEYQNATEELLADYAGSSGEGMHLLFWSVLEQGIHLLGKSLNSLKGHFKLYSSIPIGVGMGASAALCVAMTRWFIAQKLLTEDNLHLFAKNLENLFHGQSSGLDIAGVNAESGIFFKEGKSSKIKQAWKPNWYLSSCGQIGMTSNCITTVQNLWKSHEEYAREIDLNMVKSVKLATDALSEDLPQSQEMLASAINIADECFKSWGLVSESLQQHMQKLRDYGAIAVKPTGSGGGGYVLSLWDTVPEDTGIEMIAV